ncbi:uncharacterized protein BCR38DRAFT_364385, partial [Pseudomassariella vexata]
MMVWTLRFDDVLNASKLNDSLWRLIEIDGWRKLGGRLRMNESKKLELHIPKEFTPERPAVRFTHVTFTVPIGDHPLASQLPKATLDSHKPTMSLGSDKFLPLAVREGTPRTVEDLLYSDCPQLSLHVTSFTNATLVHLVGPHTLFDGMGTHMCVRAWSAVLAGKIHQVPPMSGGTSDPAASLGLGSEPEKAAKATEEPYLLASKQLKGLKLFHFTLRSLWDKFRRPNVETRTICIPSSLLQTLQAQAKQDLEKQVGEKSEIPFVSEGDVLITYLTLLIARAQSRPRPLTVYNVIEVRSRLKSVFAEGSAYVQNLAFGAVTLLSASEASNLSLGVIAAKIRESIATQSTEAQLMAFIHLMRQELDRTGKFLVVSEPDAMMVVFTNWQKARFFDVIDFSPAVVRTGDTSKRRVTPSGKISYHHCESLSENSQFRNAVIVLGKDHGGNYWLSGALNP